MSTRVGDPGRARTIVGYCWPWTVRPGESLDFMVSAETAGSYRADLVRITCAESLSNPKMFKERVVPAPFAGSYAARYQPTHLGSYVEIPGAPALDRLRSFTVQVMVLPTLLPAGERPRLGGIPVSTEKPVFQDQHLISRWDERTRLGWALLIDEKGRLAFLLGDGKSVHRTTLGRPLTQDQWFFVAASYVAASREISIFARHVPTSVRSNAGWPDSRIESRHEPTVRMVHHGPLRFGACSDGPGNAQRLKPAFCFSGRLDRVRITECALDSEQALSLAGTTIPDSLAPQVVGFWDFGRGIDSIDVYDLSANRLHGVTVNMPMRAVTGVDWDNSVTDWRQRPDHYSAIHFHDDDLYDAEWKKDFSYTVPQDLPSGIYAARLRHGEFEDYIPFFVAPPRGKAHAHLALLIPTATYTAYTNVTGLTSMHRKRQIRDGSGQTRIIEENYHAAILQDAADADYLLKNLRTLGKGIYANHTDGTLFGVASQKHPNMTIKPKGIQWTLPADSLITDWLEQKKIPYDIITDDLLHAEGVELLSRYKVVMTATHPEYYSKDMMDAVEAYQDSGGRLMYLGGNGFFWVTSFHPQLPGAIEVRKDMYAGRWKQYEIRHSFDGVHGDRWEKNGRAPQSVVGVGFDDFTGYAMEGGAPYRRLSGSYDARAAFIFEGVTNEVFGDYGVLGGGAAGQEFDRISAELGTPAHALHLARADQFPSYVSMFDKEYELNAPQPFGDMVFFETPNAGATFSAGSMTWAGSLSHNDYDNDVSRITENVLRRFMDQAPFDYSDNYDD